jgi:hypothetical protein
MWKVLSVGMVPPEAGAAILYWTILRTENRKLTTGLFPKQPRDHARTLTAFVLGSIEVVKQRTYANFP